MAYAHRSTALVVENDEMQRTLVSLLLEESEVDVIECGGVAIPGDLVVAAAVDVVEHGEGQPSLRQRAKVANVVAVRQVADGVLEAVHRPTLASLRPSAKPFIQPSGLQT